MFEFVKGQTLADRLRQGPLNEQQTLFVIREICDALTEAHSEGIIHRDLKPANLMIERIGDRPAIKILDFGIAKNLSTTGHTLGHLGHAGHMSPEQGRGVEPDGRSDLYALGIIAYECLTGKLPFDADNGIAIVQLHLTAQPPTFADLALGLNIDPEMEEFVRHLLEKEPAERPETAREAWQYATELMQDLSEGTGSHNSIALGLVAPDASGSVLPTSSSGLSRSQSRRGHRGAANEVIDGAP